MCNIIGDKNIFAIEYTFFKNTHDTELSMYINGANILAFKKNNSLLTTRWNLDDLAEWLRDFLNNLCEDPFPFKADGEYASIKDINARDFDTDDEDAFDAYYDKLSEWDFRHRWHPASNGAILADLYFQKLGNKIEISWNNTDFEENVDFLAKTGGALIEEDIFIKVIDSFLKEYANFWFN